MKRDRIKLWNGLKQLCIIFYEFDSESESYDYRSAHSLNEKKRIEEIFLCDKDVIDLPVARPCRNGHIY